MQQDDRRSFTLVMIGDPNSVKGSERVHSRLSTQQGRAEGLLRFVFRVCRPVPQISRGSGSASQGQLAKNRHAVMFQVFSVLSGYFNSNLGKTS
jgi:hypothetical protein